MENRHIHPSRNHNNIEERIIRIIRIIRIRRRIIIGKQSYWY